MCEVVAVVGKFLPENALCGGAGAGGRAGRACAGCHRERLVCRFDWRETAWGVEDPQDEQGGHGSKYPEVGGRKVKGGRHDVYC